jgi:hypothetical protein
MLEALDEKKQLNKYIELESELILLSKGTEEREIYLTSECNLHNMESSLLKCVKIIDNHYKIVWSDIFLYLIGEKSDKDITPTLLTNELRMLRISSKPLSNYLRSK